MSRESEAFKKGCIDKTWYETKLKVKLAYFKVVFIHPNNNTYPIFSVIVRELMVDVLSKCDHAKMLLVIKNFQIMDRTAYPSTLDPETHYDKDTKMERR